MRSAPNPSRRRRIRAASALLFASALLLSATANAAVIYVDPGATGMNNGTTWTDAFTDLQVALASAGYGDELWLVQATYTPHPTDRTVSFVIPDGVSLYGGFVGGEASVSDRGNIYATVLSGEIGNPALLIDNSYHVVDVSFTSAATRIDGCTITKGHADGPTRATWAGGGIYNVGGSPVLKNISVYQNYAYDGGGIYNSVGAAPQLTTVTLTGNESEGLGGGMSCYDSTPTLLNVAALSNVAPLGSGGGLYYENSGGSATALLVSGNSAAFGGGGMYCYNSSPSIVNGVFIDNDADYGGGIVTGDMSHVQFVNVTFTGNTATTSGGALQCQVSSNPKLVNCIMWNDADGGGSNEITVLLVGGTPEVQYTDIEGGVPPSVVDGGNNISADPLFISAARPGPFSPCIDTGNTGANPETVDALFHPRVVGAAIDMGAYEYACPAGPVMYVDQNSFAYETGGSWANAYRSLQVGIQTADFCAGVNEIWVAQGTYRTSPLPADRSLSFVPANGVGIYGGFDATETMRSQRDWNANPTILTGEIGMGGSSDNAYHVVHSVGNDQTAVLDGFTINEGNADGGGLDDIGAGILVEGGNPTFANLVVANNAASFAGGGMANLFGAFPRVRDAVFRNNSASSGGGVENDASSAIFVNVVFEGNTAVGNGGGMDNFGGNQPLLTNVVFEGNTANFGGAMSNDQSWPNVINVTFGGNHANVRGGGIYNITYSGPMMTNSVLFGNTAVAGGNEVYNEASAGAPSPSYQYSLIAGSGGSGVGWDAGLGTDNGNNIDGDPLFVDLLGGNLRLQNTSPCINIGDSFANSEVDDVDGNTRIVGAAIDMGAYEFPAPVGVETPMADAGTGITSAHPNPFNPTVTIDYAVRDAAHVTLAVYDVRGALVATLVDERVTAGTRSVQWQGRDAHGNRVASGVYLVRMTAAGETSLRKVVMLK